MASLGKVRGGRAAPAEIGLGPITLDYGASVGGLADDDCDIEQLESVPPRWVEFYAASRTHVFFKEIWMNARARTQRSGREGQKSVALLSVVRTAALHS